MTTPTAPSSVLDHRLQPHFEELARFESTRACESSALYQRLKPDLDRVLGSIELGTVSRVRPKAHDVVRATAWNVERGIQLDGIVRALRGHPVLSRSDVLLLTEVDYGMARTANRHVAREIAESLGLEYVFAPCYLALNKGAGVEAEVEGGKHSGAAR